MQRNAKNPQKQGNTIVFNICQPTLRSLKNNRPVTIAFGTELTIEDVRAKTGELKGRKKVCMERFMLRFPATKKLRKSVLVPIGYDSPVFTDIPNFVKNIVPVIPQECKECKKEILLKAFHAKKSGYEVAFQSELTYAFLQQAYFLPQGAVTHVGCDANGNMYVKTTENKQYFIFTSAVQKATKAAWLMCDKMSSAPCFHGAFSILKNYTKRKAIIAKKAVINNTICFFDRWSLRNIQHITDAKGIANNLITFTVFAAFVWYQ